MGQLQFWRGLSLVVAGGMMTACVSLPTKSPEVVTEPAVVVCKPVAADDPIVGNWINKRTQKGVAGELRTLFTLQADGKMLYTEQVKRPRQPSQGLSENGCWWREGSQLVLKTLESNGVPIDNTDPIYTNHYAISSLTESKLHLRSAEGVEYKADRMSPGYRLPF